MVFPEEEPRNLVLLNTINMIFTTWLAGSSKVETSGFCANWWQHIPRMEAWVFELLMQDISNSEFWYNKNPRSMEEFCVISQKNS